MDVDDGRLGGLGALEIANRIYEIGLLASQTGDLDRVIHSICERLVHVTGADTAGIGLVDETGEWLVHRGGTSTDGSVMEPGDRRRVGEGVPGTVAATGKPMCVADVRREPRSTDRIGRTRSELAYPLAIDGRVVGVLDLGSEQVDSFGPATLALVQALGTPVALAIRNASLMEEQHARFQELQRLSRVSEVITSSVDLATLLERTVESIREQFGYDFVALGLVEGEPERVVLEALSTPFEVEMSVGHSQPLGEGVTGSVVQTGRSMLLADAGSFPGRVSTGLGLGSEMCCPLRVGGRSFGFLDAESRRKGAFDDSDLLILETVADHIAPALQNAQNLQRNEQLREDMYGMLVHDMRNPLTVIGSSVDLLERTLVDMGRSQEGETGALDSALRKVHHARGACDQMLVMIDAMLELHRIETDGLAIRRRPCDGGSLVTSVARSLSTVAESEEIAVSVDADERAVDLPLDPEVVSRVIENLVVNALKFTPPAGRLDIAVSMVPGRVAAERLEGVERAVLFTVRDTGKGIPEEEQERIFERFAVVRSRRRGRKYSTGLGLAYCKQAVRAHGGAIWVESTPGCGSCFFVLLPA
jgi:signal transduction histidine kinase